MMDLESVETIAQYYHLKAGDAAPWFQQRTPHNPEFRFDTLGGRYILLGFFGSSVVATGQAVFQTIQKRRAYFDDVNLCFFGVTVDPKDETERHLGNIIPGIRFFYDFDGHVSKRYGALPYSDEDNTQLKFRPFWLVLDRMLRVVANVPFSPDGRDADNILPILDALPPFAGTAEMDLMPPVLMLPNIFEPELCQHLIGLYQTHGGEESGFMNEVQGKTLGVYDYSHKRRRDYFIQDQSLIEKIQRIFVRRLMPEIAKAFQYDVTHIERHIVACYSTEDGGHFNAHRDNTTLGTAHRRFAVTLNLNEDFDGGELSFPEFGKRSYKASLGGVIVFSCSLLHAASLVTRGTRYAYLPFLYDQAAAKIRDVNRASILDADKTKQIS